MVTAINEVKDDVDSLVLDWTIEGTTGTATANTGDVVQYIGDTKLIETAVSKTDDTITVEIKNTLTPNLVAGDIVYSPTTTNIGRLGIGDTGETLRVVNGLPEWTIGGTVDEDFAIKFDGGTAEDTDLFTFDGSTAKTINVVGGTDITIDKDTETNGLITFKHDEITRTNTTSASAPAFAGTFAVVDGITTSAQGHITAVNTKTITVPTETTLSVVDEGAGTWVTGATANDHEITLTRSNTTEDTITVGELVVDSDGAGNGNITIDGALRGPAEFFIDAYPHDNIGGEVIINGDLIVRGVTTTVNSENVTIKDAFIQLNFDGDASQSSTPTLDAGIEIERYSGTNVRLLWNETDDDWEVTTGTALYNQLGDDPQTGGYQEFTQFTLFHSGNFVIPVVNQPISNYDGPVYVGAMVYEVTEIINGV